MRVEIDLRVIPKAGQPTCEKCGAEKVIMERHRLNELLGGILARFEEVTGLKIEALSLKVDGR